MAELTQNRKIALYRSNRYSCKPPPCTTIFWEMEDWIKWIDNQGVWHGPESVHQSKGNDARDAGSRSESVPDAACPMAQSL